MVAWGSTINQVERLEAREAISQGDRIAEGDLVFQRPTFAADVDNAEVPWQDCSECWICARHSQVII